MGLSDVRVDLELAKEPVDDDLEVEFAHTRDQGLPGFGIHLDPERRVLDGKLLETGPELLLVVLGLWLDCNGDDRIRELDGFKQNRMVVVGQGVAGTRVAQSHRRRDVARPDLFDVLTLVRVHLEESADSFLLSLAGIENVGARPKTTRIDAKNERVPT